MDKINIEYELKAWAPVEDKLNEMVVGFSKDTKIENQIDKYYDNKNRDLFKFGVFLRNRNDKMLDIKYNPNQNDNSHFDCEETSFSLPLSIESINKIKSFLNQFYAIREHPASEGSLDSVLYLMGLEHFVTINKQREVFRKIGVEFCIDTVNELGKFIEIECTDQETSKKYIEWTIKEGISPIPVGYVELYLRKHDFRTYLTGRYLLDEDRNQ